MRSTINYILVVSFCLVAACLGPALDAYDISKRAYRLGYERGYASAPDLTGQCMAFWFNGDPILADKKLKAACAARKK